MPVSLAEIDTRDLMESCLWIKAKGGKIVPFMLNHAQNDYWPQRSPRDIIVKARQLGWSTLILGEFFAEAALKGGIDVVVVAHEDKSTRKIFEIVRFFYDHLPDTVKPRVSSYSATQLAFPDMNSSIYVGTAGARAFGHGDTIHRALLSEFDLWPLERAETILGGIEGACPLEGRIVKESTVWHGIGGILQRHYEDAKYGRSGYKAFFYPWFWDKTDYRMPHKHPLALPNDKGKLTYTEEELELVALHDLTEDQIRWRRYASATIPNFLQNFPEDDMTCFMIDKGKLFDMEVLKKLKEQCYEGEYHDEIQFWEAPEMGKDYIIGADTSLGTDKGDYAAAIVLERRSMKHVATLHGHFHPQYFKELLEKLGFWYNNAYIAVERAGYGHAVIEGLMVDGYENLYFHVDYDNVTNKIVAGFPTNMKTRPILVRDMITTVNEGLVDTHDEELVRELMSVERFETRGAAGDKVMAPRGYHDDRFIALGIAIQARNMIGAEPVDSPIYVKG